MLIQTKQIFPRILPICTNQVCFSRIIASANQTRHPGNIAGGNIIRDLLYLPLQTFTEYTFCEIDLF